MSIASATEYAQSIADQITARVGAGTPFGITHDYEGWADIDGEEYTDYSTNTETEWREADAYDYLESILDIEYIVSADRTYKAARILIAFGGPTAWINTNTGQVEAAWWSETVYRDLPREFINELDNALAELYEMG